MYTKWWNNNTTDEKLKGKLRSYVHIFGKNAMIIQTIIIKKDATKDCKMKQKALRKREKQYSCIIITARLLLNIWENK